jgi:hypothetical protein
MRSRLFAIVTIAGLLMTIAPPARADHAWDAFGPRFSVGGLSFVLAFGQPRYSYPRGYYYQVAHPLSYRGHHCSSACFRDGHTYYHHDGCPLVRQHFHHYGVDPHDVHARYAPRHRYDDRYDQYDGHDRYDRHDRYGRYDRSGRYRGRHDRYDDRYGRRDRDHGRYDRHDRDRYDRDHRYRGRGDRYDRYDDDRRGRGHSRGRGRGHRHHVHDRYCGHR